MAPIPLIYDFKKLMYPNTPLSQIAEFRHFTQLLLCHKNKDNLNYSPSHNNNTNKANFFRTLYTYWKSAIGILAILDCSKNQNVYSFHEKMSCRNQPIILLISIINFKAIKPRLVSENQNYTSWVALSLFLSIKSN